MNTKKRFIYILLGPVIFALTALLLKDALTLRGAQAVGTAFWLIFGSTLICLPWAACGLDRRVALKALSLIGPSMKSQITVWLLASIVLSMALPNVMVCPLFTPIAVTMLSAAGYDDIATCAPAVPIL